MVGLYEEVEALGVTIEERHIPIYGYCGQYHMIILDETLSDRQRLCVLQHEIIQRHLWRQHLQIPTGR